MKQVYRILFASLMLVLPFTVTQAGEALDRVMSENVLKIATDANWPPQSFINDNNEMDGFDVDVGRELANRLGVDVEFVTPEWDVITAGRWNGRWDLSIGSMTPTPSRAEVLSFPAVYYYTPAAFVVHEDSAATQASDLNGKVVGTGSGTTFEQYLEKDLTIDAEGAPPFEYLVDVGEIRTYDNSATAMEDLRLGDGVRLDGVISSMPTILEAIDTGRPLKIIGDPVFYEPLALAIEKGDPEFNDKLGSLVEEMRADGTLGDLSEKWYGVDYSTAE